MSSPTVQRRLSWWKRLLERWGRMVWAVIGIGCTVVTFLALPLVFPELVSYYGGQIQEADQQRREWLSTIDPRWIHIPFGVVLGAGGLLFVLWVFVEWQDKWKKALWDSFRQKLSQFKRARQQIGRVTVRYGMVQGDAERKEFWPNSQKMWKGKEARLFFSKSLRPIGSLCFIEFPEPYEVVFLSHSKTHWFECNSPTLGYRRYESNLPLDDHTAHFIVGTDDRGTGGWSAAWVDIKRGSEAIVEGQSTF